jgi:hypothetical protein
MLAVPINQRAYAWKEKHVTDLYQDIQGAISNNEPEYFLGSIVVTRSENDRPQVVDGQQRLATSVILLAAIRDYFLDTKDEERAQVIEKDYLLRRSLETLEEEYRLRLSEVDNDYFSKRIVLRPEDSRRKKANPTRGSHHRIELAAKIAAKHVRGLVSTHRPEDKHKQLNRLVQFVEDGVKVIWVTVADEAGAYMIFETMNDRGLRLSAADLLKNYLLGRSDDRIKETHHHWLTMTGALETIPDDQIVVTYIRHLWISGHAPVRTPKLFDAIKEEIKSKQKAVSFAVELSESAPRYIALLNSAHEMWNAYDPSVRRHVDTLARLGMEQIRPLMLAALSKFPKGDIKNFMLMAVCWSIRFLITGTPSGTLEGYYGRYALDIHSGKIKNARQLLKSMGPLVPDDESFKSAFVTSRVSQSHFAKYYLRALQQEADGSAEPQYVPNDGGEINLEHILPQSPSEEWEDIDTDMAEALTRRLGNMALLQASQNQILGNKSYEAKKPVLKASSFSLTREAGEHDKWGREEINDRQQKLAQLAVKTWPHKPF